MMQDHLLTWYDNQICEERNWSNSVISESVVKFFVERIGHSCLDGFGIVCISPHRRVITSQLGDLHSQNLLNSRAR
jgi:hypothetical protein